MPISALLARIRRLVPENRDPHYDEIVRSFGVGALRPPPTPMSDGELARAIAEFLKDTPSTESVATLGRRLDPSCHLYTSDAADDLLCADLGGRRIIENHSGV